MVLVFAAAVSAVVRDWSDALIVLASSLLGFCQEYSASSAMGKLKARISRRAVVMRGLKATSSRSRGFSRPSVRGWRRSASSPSGCR